MDRRTFVQATARTAVGLGILRYASACRPAGPGDAGFADLRDRYFVHTLELNPVTSTYLGGDGYSDALSEVNGQLRDYSPEAIAAEVSYYRNVVRDLERIDPATLNDGDRIDHAVMGAQIAYMLHQLDDRRYQQRSTPTWPSRSAAWTGRSSRCRRSRTACSAPRRSGTWWCGGWPRCRTTSRWRGSTC